MQGVACPRSPLSPKPPQPLHMPRPVAGRRIAHVTCRPAEPDSSPRCCSARPQAPVTWTAAGEALACVGQEALCPPTEGNREPPAPREPGSSAGRSSLCVSRRDDESRILKHGLEWPGNGEAGTPAHEVRKSCGSYKDPRGGCYCKAPWWTTRGDVGGESRKSF